MLRRAGPVAFLLTIACTTGSGGSSDAGRRLDAGRDAAAIDAGPTRCESTADCDDAIACTLDECVIDNVCRHDPLDARCADGARCVVGRGCVTGSGMTCATPADCNDGVRCNGDEQCIAGMCFAGSPLDCDDGNECTVDVCDESASSGCRYEPAPGCDAGVPPGDAGPMCAAFDPARHYAGTFSLLPGQGCDAGTDGYNISSVSFSLSGGNLTVTAGRFVMTQSPAPSGPDFNVSGGDGCATVRLEGRFSCETQFRATWTANHGGACGTCGSASSPVAGRRR